MTETYNAHRDYPRRIAAAIAIAAMICIELLPSFAQHPAQNTATTPDQIVSQLYKNDSGIIVSSKKTNDSRLSNYFDSRLGGLILKDHHESDDANTLDFDPLFDTNGGTAVTNFHVNAPKINADAASVVVEFILSESKNKRRINFSLQRTSHGWRISDVATGDWDLLKLLSKLHGKG